MLLLSIGVPGEVKHAESRGEPCGRTAAFSAAGACCNASRRREQDVVRVRSMPGTVCYRHGTEQAPTGGTRLGGSTLLLPHLLRGVQISQEPPRPLV